MTKNSNITINMKTVEIIETKTKNDKVSDNKVTGKKLIYTTISSDKKFIDFPHNNVFNGNNKIGNGLNDARSYIVKANTKCIKKLFIFSEDNTQNATKQFYTLTHDLVYNLAKQKRFHLYENYAKGEQVKLHLDIDIKGNYNNSNTLDAAINASINLVNNELEKYKFNPDNAQIIILKSSRDNKQSAHIIYNNIHFEDIYYMKFFMTEIKSPLIRDKIIDLNIYKTGCFRMLWNSKIGVNVNLEYHSGINYNYIDDKTLFMDCLIQNINTPQLSSLTQSFKPDVKIPENVKLKTSIKATDIKKINTKLTKFTKVPIKMINKYLSLISVKRADDYYDWLYLGMALHNCNYTEECFNLWLEFSKQSDSYDGEDICKYKWNSFNGCGYGMGSLKLWAKRDNPEEYDKMEYAEDKHIFESVKVNKQYLLDNKLENHDGNIVWEHIKQWYNPQSKTKCLAMKSEYGTAKTTLIKTILDKYKPSSFLFVSYRQSLANELFGVFKEYKVLNYLDNIYVGTKFICQLESLHKLLPQFTYDDISDTDELVIQSYDVVFLDEIEGLLNHLRSKTIDRKEDTFNVLTDIIHNAKKVLACDGDFGNRGYTFLKSMGETVVIENEYKKNPKHFIFINDRKFIEGKILNDLDQHLNIIVTCMSASIATYMYNQYKDKYKCILYCSKSDDALKADLKDVENVWNKVQIVFYSPVIESGVNFNVEHFHSLYVILCKDSCSQRGLTQMFSRCRQFKNNNIYVYLNGLPYREKILGFNYDEVKEYVIDLNNQYGRRIVVTDPKTGKRVLKRDYKFGTYEEMCVYNEVEHLNKHPHYFVGILIKILKSKGHTYEHIDIENKKKSVNKGSMMKEELISAEDISKTEYAKLFGKKIKNEATHEDKIKLERYDYIEYWKLDTLDALFLERWYGKNHVLHNIRTLLGITDLHPIVTLEKKGEHVINHEDVKTQELNRMIKQVLKTLGYTTHLKDCLTNGTEISRDTFDENYKKVLTSCDLFLNQNRSNPLLETKKSRNICSIKSFMGYMNTILDDYGMVIKCINKIVRIKGQQKRINQYTYKLLYVNEINKYI